MRPYRMSVLRLGDWSFVGWWRTKQLSKPGYPFFLFAIIYFSYITSTNK